MFRNSKVLIAAQIFKFQARHSPDSCNKAAGTPSDCRIRVECLNGEFLGYIYGTTQYEWIGGLDNCKSPYCLQVSYCYYNSPGLTGIDENSVQIVQNGQITGSSAGIENQNCSPPSGCGYTQYNSCKKRYYCNGEYIGIGCGGDCYASPPGLGEGIEGEVILDKGILYEKLIAQKPELKPIPYIKGNNNKILYDKSEEEFAVNSNAAKFSFQAYPNPFTDEIVTNVYVETKDKISILLFDINGKVLHKDNFEVEIGWNETLIKTDQKLPPGVYLLKVIFSNGYQEFVKLIKSP